MPFFPTKYQRTQARLQFPTTMASTRHAGVSRLRSTDCWKYFLTTLALIIISNHASAENAPPSSNIHRHETTQETNSHFLETTTSDDREANIDSEPLKIGILAKRGRQKCLKRWEPTAEYLNKQLPDKHFVIVPLDFDEIDYYVQKGKIDFLLANSAIFVRMDAKYGLSPIATLTNMRLDRPCSTFGGVLFCRKDHPTIRTIDDLEGKSLAAVDRTSMGGWIAAWRELHAAGIEIDEDLASVTFSGTHDQVVYDVLSEKVDAGTVRTDTLERMDQEGAIDLDDFRVLPHFTGEEGFPFLHSTQLYPEWPLAALQHVPQSLSQEVAIALFGISPNNAAAKAAKCAGWSTPHSYQPVHDSLKEVGLSPYGPKEAPSLVEVLKHHWHWGVVGLLVMSAAMVVMLLIARMNRKLRSAKAELESVFNASIPMIAIDFDHRILRVNDDACQMLEMNREELILRKCYEILCNERCHTQDCPLHRLPREKRRLEQEITTKIDSRENRTYLVTASHLQDAEQQCIGAVESFHDITERKKTENWLEMVKTAIESTSDAIGICNIDRKHIYHNKAFTEKFGYTQEEFQEVDPTVLYEDKCVAKRVFETILAGNKWSGEVNLKNQGGRIIPIDLRADAIRNEKGEIIGLIGVHTDITERKHAEHCLQDAKKRAEALNEHLEKQTSIARNMTARAEQANRAKSEFLANMSHEIRTPMTAILGFADILLEQEDERNMTPEHREFLVTIRRNGEYLLGLINDILDLSKIEANRLCIQKEKCSAVQILSEVLSLMRIRASSKNLELEIRYLSAIPKTIYCDPRRLRQILINLIGNAIKFTHSGKVAIETKYLSPRDDHRKAAAKHLLEFRISDSGIGMTREETEKVFRPFTQVDNSVSRKYEGTGLGLTISKRLVEMLGGRIEVQSVPGEGSTFTVTIETGPLDDVEWIENLSELESHATSQPDEDGAFSKLKLRGKVLVAEDGLDNQRLLSLLLNKHGVEVTVVENGKQACETYSHAKFHGTPFDLILMDMQMPVMDGYTATRKLRHAGCECPIIALTAHAMEGSRKKCLEAGCDEYLSKPIQRRTFIEMVQHHLARKHSLQR